MRGATEVPLEVLERCSALAARLGWAAESPAKFASDVITARALAEAARTGARANVDINLDGFSDGEFEAGVEKRLAAIS